jgi:inositol hexakisphosphate/diphosphoinositol-pentakisphosphate kinase
LVSTSLTSEKQKLLFNRMTVCDELQNAGVQVPPHLVVRREEGRDLGETFIETPDYIEFDGQRLYKPFIEKPISGTIQSGLG